MKIGLAWHWSNTQHNPADNVTSIAKLPLALWYHWGLDDQPTKVGFMMNNAQHDNLLENIHCLLFDLDDTLYPQDSGVWDRVGVRINQYLVDRMHIPAEEVSALRSRLFIQYGTTLRGLQVEDQVNMKEYLDFVHDVPLEDILSPDPELDQILSTLPLRKVVFTNAYTPYAQQVLALLGINHHFEQIIDIYTLYPYCKPEAQAFHKALEAVGEEAEHCLLIDDNPKNLAMAQSLGMKTVSIGKYRHDGSPHISEIKEIQLLLS